MEKEIIFHESFGQIQLSRTTGNGTHFYGSELPQDHYITLEVHQSELQRSLVDDRYFNRDMILKVRLSSGQFAEMLTSMNYGTGVPCTIERVAGKKIPPLPFTESRKEFVHRKFEDRMKDFAARIKDGQARAKELVKKKTLSKSDIHELNLHIEWLSAEIQSNIPFFAKCFQETMDEVVLEAKTEIENAVQHRISTLGLEALHEQNRLLKQ